MEDLEKYEMKLYRPPIGPTAGCLIYFGTLALVFGIMAVGAWGLYLAVFR